jgi:transcription termination/antitermination protein NusG
MTVTLQPAWYVLHTKSRFENVVNDALLKKAVEAFLPKITVASKRKDRKKMIQVPLFPGYVFVKSDLHPNHHLEVVQTAGAVKLVGNKSGPISVPDEAIASIKIMVASRHPVDTGYQFNKGDRVMVVNGPFIGVVGIFERYGSKGRIVVHIEALNQFAAVEVETEDVEKMPDIGS